ncbi:SAM-dependent methyltransferase, partial [Nocardia carnea]|uniref:SAM-dependent methyltransferase n=1 Tax=Nocardia carnea TaxID=37328 RepID=UPI00245444FA
LVCGLLDLLVDVLDPGGVMREYYKRLADGSYVALTNFWDPEGENPELSVLARNLQRAFVEMGLGSGWYRPRDRLLEYLDGLDLIPPGLVELEDWFPSGPPARSRLPEERVLLGGVGHKRMPAPVQLRQV